MIDFRERFKIYQIVKLLRDKLFNRFISNIMTLIHLIATLTTLKMTFLV